jgi:predicted nucleic acid-binding protein
MMLVLDASVTLAWLYRDERSEPVAQVFAIAAADSAAVPTIWHLEVANGLQLGIRRGRIDADYRDGALADLSDFAITTDAETGTHAWKETLALADRFRLTLYDACYLELAQRLRLPLASLDRELRAAGESLGLELLGA